MVEVTGVTMQFDELTAVDNLSFKIEPGQIVGLLGANGAGKTTTFRMIMGILNPTKGKVTYNNRTITIADGHEIGFLAEERALLTKYTVERQLHFFAELKNMDKSEIDQQIDYWLDLFDLKEKKYNKIKELSKGNQQKIQFISAVIHKPKLLILDEPFSGLDPFNVDIFKQQILRLKDQGTSIIFSSHRLDHVEYFCEDVIVLVKGKDVLRGKITDLKNNSSLNKVVIKSDVPISELEKLSCVREVERSGDLLNVFVYDSYDANKIFELLKSYNCTHFSLELPSFEEIFVKEVGKKYES